MSPQPSQPQGPGCLVFWYHHQQLPWQQGFIFPDWMGEFCPPPEYLFPAKDLGRTPNPPPSLGRMASSCPHPAWENSSELCRFFDPET